MRHPASSRATTVFLILLLVPACRLQAQDFPAMLEQMLKVRKQVQLQTTQLLSLLKEIRGPAQSGKQKARISLAGAAVRESENTTARLIAQLPLNTEYPVLEEREDWFRIRLDDGREGWIDRSSIQLISQDDRASTPPSGLSEQNRSELRTIAETLLFQINRQAGTVATALESAKQSFADLAPADRERDRSSFEQLAAHADKVREYEIYANHYFEKIARDIPAGVATAKYPGPIQAQIILQGGNSSYTSQGEQSVSAQNLQFDGSMEISEQSRVTAQLGRRSEIIQSPYTTNDVRFGYQYAASPTTSIASFASLNSFTDEAFARNDFTRLGAGATLNSMLGSTGLLTVDLKYDGKSYDDTTGNAYKGGHLSSTLRLNSGGDAEWQLGLAGSMQSSDVQYLNFTRVIPSIQFRSRDIDGSTSARAEFESMGYGEEAGINDYQRGQLDIGWMRGNTQRQMLAIGKFFPNNAGQNYLRVGGSTRSSSGGALTWQRSLVSVMYVYFLEQGDGQTDYTDIRSDHSSTNESTYWNLDLFSRLWSDFSETSNRDHLIDLLARFGWTISGIQVGPLVGLHLRVRKGEQFFKRDGNSISTGAEARGMVNLGFGTLNLSLRYERDIVYASNFVIDAFGNATSTSVGTRNPSTLQFIGDLRVPVSTDLEFTLMIDTYDVNLDLSPENSINPIESRSRMNILAGVGYRFAIQP
ncbi:MAG: SH3 domain-containing protein [Bacteroidota bacterium]|jgi:hypothetical protein